MKKSQAIIFLPALLVLFSFNMNKKQSYRLTLPVCISYIKDIPPPDSIQTFITVYLQSKKVKVIDWNEAMRLFQAETKSEAMRLITSGNLNKKTTNNFADRVEPVSNVLAIQVFRNSSADSLNYKIDSISWQTSFVPAKDGLSRGRLVFIPGDNQEANPYHTLKNFLDKVLNSGYLK